MADRKKCFFCKSSHHVFGKIVLREIRRMRGSYCHQRGYRECQNKNCSLIIEMRREIWLDAGNKIMGFGPWQEDEGFVSLFIPPKK